MCYLNVSSRLIETLTSVSIRKKSFKFARPWIFTTVRWIMQWSVNYSSLPDRDGCALKSMQKWGSRMWCCVNTFHSGLLTRQIFVSTLILAFLMFASNKVPVTNQFWFACFNFWSRMIHCWNDITLFSIDFYNYFRKREQYTEGILAQISLEQSCLQLVGKATYQEVSQNLRIEQCEKIK